MIFDNIKSSKEKEVFGVKYKVTPLMYAASDNFKNTIMTQNGGDFDITRQTI